jgi:hypothetical protein
MYRRQERVLPARSWWYRAGYVCVCLAWSRW